MSKLSSWKTIFYSCVLCAVAVIALPAQSFKTLHSFDGTDGANPFAALVQATDGNFYGTTEAGGPVNGDCYEGSCGTVFKIAPSGTLTTLYRFCSQSGCTDGEAPYAPLVQATNGNFYGTTSAGGTDICSARYGCGAAFEITPGGKRTTLHNFSEGVYPFGGLVQATDGNLYGTTWGGGVHFCCGTVFKITPSGTLTTLHSFCSQSRCADGEYPEAGLIQATNGNFYGTTNGGGASHACLDGCGTVFEITPAGKLTTLYSFDGTDGSEPYAGLVQGTNGDFYGTTESGGASDACSGGCGTVFKITPAGKLTTLHSFDGTDGSEPYAGLVQATNGNFYGTTVYGGANMTCYGGGCGAIFEITPAGKFTTLYSFCSQTNCTDGANPYAGLVQATDGTFYETTGTGGAYSCNGFGCGTLFSLGVGLGPFVETQPTSGKVGAPVKILGTSLTGATSVSFDGTAAALKVVLSSLITTTVPAGATTGKVKVKTPHGTLTSNVNFRVTP